MAEAIHLLLSRLRPWICSDSTVLYEHAPGFLGSMLWAGAWHRCWPELMGEFPVAQLPITSPSPSEFSAEGTLKPGLACGVRMCHGEGLTHSKYIYILRQTRNQVVD